MSFWWEAGAVGRARGAKAVDFKQGTWEDSPPWSRDHLPKEGYFNYFLSFWRRVHSLMITCMCKIKNNSLCRLKINHASGFKLAFILGTPVFMVANTYVQAGTATTIWTQKIFLAQRNEQNADNLYIHIMFTRNRFSLVGGGGMRWT